jgi:CHAT domain-containing protein
VDGWAPTVLDSGGSGFIGGLWPLSDQGAAAFAAHFYAELNQAIHAGGSPLVSKLLQDSRQGFFESGDPTYLGYVYYGDVNLAISHP